MKLVIKIKRQIVIIVTEMRKIRIIVKNNTCSKLTINARATTLAWKVV